ncbi:MAG TPA: PAS domain-containing sensor histidine kinase [Pyrinomonadaceae bacterium]|jgi:PAS domain S-box-containing protein
MSENEKLLRLASDLTPFDLPIGVYVVTRDGRFVKCNRRAREILRLPLDGEIDDTIIRFYRDPELREKMHLELMALEAQGGHMEKLVAFEVNGHEIFVQDFTRSLRDDDDEIVGYVSCMTDVTEGERSNRQLESLPAGVYKLDAADNWEQANRAFARILGYDSPDEIAGQPSDMFYVSHSEAAKLRQMVVTKHPEPVTNFIAEMRKKNGETIFVNINAHMVQGDDGGYAGREGTIIDVTREERYSRILRDVPVGLNVIRHEGDKDSIVHCNDQFLKLFAFRDLNQARGYDARLLHASPEEYARFKRALEDAAKLKRPLVAYRLEVVTLKNEQMTVEISSQPLEDSEGNIIGRTNALRDIRQEVELRDLLDELTYDIGNVLHTYTTTLLMVHLSIEPVIRSLAPDPFPSNREMTPELASEAIVSPTAQMAAALKQLLDLAREEDRAQALPKETWASLNTMLAMFTGEEEQAMEADFRPVVLGEAALRIIKICLPLSRSHKFSRDHIRTLRDAAQWVLRVTNLISLHQVRDAVLEMDHQVRSLREFVTSKTREPEARTVYQATEIVAQARQNLDDYARNRRVDIKIEREEAEVRVVQREVVRALTNILHNAIKYSWSRDKSKSPWITIRTTIVDGFVLIDFENWGVPIPREEIEKELIFKIGYRGRLSGDRGRVGTGIGLADARRVARAHGGDVIVESHPAVGSRRDDNYTQPFITNVTMKLPLHTAQGASHEN